MDPSIVRGERAQLGEIPWQAFVREVRPDGTASACGGSLIHPIWVFTAAHCIDTPGARSEVRLGGINRNQLSYRQYANLRIKHERYDSRTITNDVALLRLPVAAQGQHIRTIQMAPSNLGDLTGVPVVASGYGYTWTGGPSSDDLMKADLIGISHQDCRAIYSGVIQSNTFCAQWHETWGQSTCSGDSGGPITALLNNGQRVLVGASSFGTGPDRGGCHTGNPRAFARVSTYRNWALSRMQANS